MSKRQRVECSCHLKTSSIVPLGRGYFPHDPGTTCLATIVLSLRDKIHSTAEALLIVETLGYPPALPNAAKASEAFSSTASESRPGAGGSDSAELWRTSTSEIVGSATSRCTIEISAPGNLDSMRLCSCSRRAYPNGTSMVSWNPSNIRPLSSRQTPSAILRSHSVMDRLCFFRHLIPMELHPKYHFETFGIDHP